MVLGLYLNAAMTTAEAPHAYAALQKALELGAPATADYPAGVSEFAQGYARGSAATSRSSPMRI